MGRGYDEINDFERTLTAEGMILVKFFLHLSDEEQLKRFEARERDPLKSWKLTDEDWRNRKKRKQYTAAIEEMLDRTDTAWAPWHLVEGDQKAWARREGRRDGQRRARGGDARGTAVDQRRVGARVDCLSCLRRCALRAAFCARVFWRARLRARSRLRRSAGVRRTGAASGRCRLGSAARASREIHQPMPMKRITKPPAIRNRVARPTSWPRTLVVLSSGVGVGGRGRRRQRPERAVLGEHGGRGREQERRAQEDEGDPAHRPRRYYAGAPVSAHRCPRKRPPQVTSRTPISPASPAQTPRMPQPWCRASSATGT